MGIFSKIWKGIKKVGKKIAKGVKNTFKKIGAAIGKLGVVGQIGMMFLMPYAMGALSSFAGSALGTVGQWSANLLSKSGIGAKALGHTLNVIHKAGTFAGKVYTTVTDTIGNAIDRVGNFSKGKGFTLSEGKTSIFAKGNERSLLSTEGYKLPDATNITKPTLAPTTPEVKLNLDVASPTTNSTGMLDLEALAKDVDIQSQLAKSIPETLAPAVQESSLLDFDVSKMDTPEFAISTPSVSELAEPPVNFMDSVKNIPSAIGDKIKSAPSDFVEGIKNYDPSRAATQTVDSIIYNKGMEFAGVDTTPDYIDDSTHVNIPEMYDMASVNRSGVFSQVDLTLAKTGNSWMGNNFQSSTHMNNLFGDGSSAYDSYMNQFAMNQYTPIQRGA
jgi:hypothetical protein|tara:strand:+ start:345 stop:1505 length:1161 start_codon:yes stop_codon:yes gene_type:complete